MRKPLNHTPFLGLAFYLLSCSCLFGQFISESFEEAKKSKSAKFYYIYDEVYGLTAADQNGNVSGVLIDMMGEFESYVERREGIKIYSEYVFEQDFKLFLKNVKTGAGRGFWSEQH